MRHLRIRCRSRNHKRSPRLKFFPERLLEWDIVVEVLPPCLGFCTFWLNFGCPRRKCDPRRLDRWELSSGVVLGLRPTDFLHERRTVRARQHIGSKRQISTMILATTKMGSRSFSRAASKSASFL